MRRIAQVTSLWSRHDAIVPIYGIFSEETPFGEASGYVGQRDPRYFNLADLSARCKRRSDYSGVVSFNPFIKSRRLVITPAVFRKSLNEAL